MLLVLKMVLSIHNLALYRTNPSTHTLCLYYHEHCVEIHLEVKNVLPRRDHGLAGAYCGRCRRPDVHVWESSPLPPSRRESISVIVIITTIQMYLYHSYMHFHVWLCFEFVAIISPPGSILPSWHHLWPMDMELWICLYSMFDIQTCIQLCFAFVAIIPPHMAPPRLWLRPHKIPPTFLDHLPTFKHSNGFFQPNIFWSEFKNSLAALIQ